MFEEFSRGYYLGRLYVEPSGDDAAKMCHTQHEHVSRQLYANSESVAPHGCPLVMKLGTCHFAVHGDREVPADTLAVPGELLDDAVRSPPTLREVLLAKADRASQLLELAPGRNPMT
jgi:hypothetical protein